MELYIINKQTPTSIKVLKSLMFILVSGLVVGGYYIYDKHVEEEENKKVVKPLSNLTYEVERIQEIYGKESIKELKLSNKTLTFKIKDGESLEPLISRYQDMINVIFNEDGYNEITIDKSNIVDYNTLKKQQFKTKNKDK